MSDSDDLKKTETEVAKLSVAIEKEMFNLCLNTDSRYKNKYRSLMFNLKDPKNKVSQRGHPCAWTVRPCSVCERIRLQGDEPRLV